MENSDKKQPPPAENPVLEQAAKEIAEVLKKHDVAGVVQMFIPGFNKYAMNLETTWSVVAVDKTGKMRMITPLVDPSDQEPAKKKIMDTVRMFTNMRIYLTKLVGVIVQAEVAVRQHFGVTPPPPCDPNLPFKN